MLSGLAVVIAWFGVTSESTWVLLAVQLTGFVIFALATVLAVTPRDPLGFTFEQWLYFGFFALGGATVFSFLSQLVNVPPGVRPFPDGFYAAGVVIGFVFASISLLLVDASVNTWVESRFGLDVSVGS